MAATGWLANARKKYLAIFEDADQDRVRNDLGTFFGPRAETYLALYEKMRAQSGNRFPRTWSWVVFFTAFPWFFYRKMYAMGAALVVMPIVLAVLFPGIGNIGGMACFAVLAKSSYVHMALDRLRKADQLGLVGAERQQYLQQAGGVSVTAGVLAGILFAAMAGLVIFALIVDPKSLR